MSDDSLVKLTKTELRIYLLLAAGEVLPKHHTIEAIVSKIRAKMSPDTIETRREGFIIGTDDTFDINPLTHEIIKRGPEY
jgi:hypothetical protein